MLKREEVRQGLPVHLRVDYLGVPAGTLGTVDDTGTFHDGTWWFTVRWHSYTPLPSHRGMRPSQYSLNLWEDDLASFEVASAEDLAATSPALLSARQKKRAAAKIAGTVRTKQLTLPFPAEDD